ncbi:PREDICTED: LRRN4 C-terminal-like protein [Cyprinodon variegatus]|uniref:LRRN4 C-terminal-like protein n=1 Tax=Cyprinodon variegatus TaxID=28743 RepID=UPI0007429AFE|nr:PREDICTED: LRRN4 C-terminal-like protein [Cyprinodon variegatus]
MRNQPLPFVIVCLLSIRGHCPLPFTPAGTGIPPYDPDLATFDYDYDTSTSSDLIKVPTNTGIPKRCDYNPCREKQPRCEELAASSGCLCQGSTLPDQRPDPPKLQSVSWNGSEVVVQWCAPNSFITAYFVTVGGEKKMFEEDHRSAVLGQIDHKAEVCVVAANEAGESNKSCMEYQPSSSSLPLTAGLIGGALGLLLLILLVVLLCRRRRQKRKEAMHVHT